MAEKSLLDAGLCIIQNAVPADAIAVAAAQAKLVTAEVMAALSDRGVDPNSGHEFVYSEVASRCRGRIDVRHRFDQEPFASLGKEGGWMHVVKEVLGGDCRMQYAGLVLSLPGSDDQGWHTDGEHLFPGLDQHTPPHAVTVFVPLVDLSSENGTPEFFLGSHVEKNAAALTEGTETDPPCSFDMKAGTVLVFDYRLVHRGTANKTGVGAIVARTNTDDDEEREDPIPKKKVKLDADGDDGDSDGGGVERALGDTNAKQDAVGRPLLYFVYSKTWWTDTRNFNTHEHLFNGKE